MYIQNSLRHLVLSITNRCEFECKTCNIWKKSKNEELSLLEYKEIFKSLGSRLISVVFTGGEPFIRNDITEICKYLIEFCSPRFITFFTSGEPSEKILIDIQQILDSANRNIHIGVLVSIDSIGDELDKIKNSKGAFSKIIKTYLKLRKVNKSNLTVGINTIYSKYNISNLQHIKNYLKSLYPDVLLILPAWGRKDLEVFTVDVSPNENDCISVYKKISDCGFSKFDSILAWNIMRNTYKFYKTFEKLIIKKEKSGKCKSGIVSGFINSKGEVMDCPVAGRVMGDLRLENFNFKKVWLSRDAEIVRKEIEKSECWCPMLSDFQANFV